MKRFNKIFAVCLTLSVLSGFLLPSPWTCGGFTEPVPIEVKADGEPTTIDSGIGVLITMLLANGIRFVGNFDDTVKPGIKKLWDDFTTATGNTVTLAMLGAQSVVQLGYLRTSSEVNNAVNAFQQWYTDTFSVANTGSVSIPVSSGGGTYYPFTENECLQFSTRSDYKCFFTSNVEGRYVQFTLTNGNRGFAFVSEHNGMWQMTLRGSACRVPSSTFTLINGYYVTSQTFSKSGYPAIELNTNYPFITDLSSWDHNTAIYYTYGDGAVIGDISMTGQTLDLLDGYDISNDQAKLIDLAGIESLVGTLGLTLDSVNDLIDSIPLIMDYPWADTFPDDPTFADTPDDAIPWVDVPTAVVPAEVPEYVPETPADEGSYKVLGLERVFPFSIPFDFIAVVNLLNSEPVCPEFTFRIYNPISGQNMDATMSFERFEAVAQVIRIVETIGFIVFLILITRSLIRS